MYMYSLSRLRPRAPRSPCGSNLEHSGRHGLEVPVPPAHVRMFIMRAHVRMCAHDHYARTDTGAEGLVVAPAQLC